MKFYAITMKPETGFGTPVKGDTLFGQFCWQAAYDPDLLMGGLDTHIAHYKERPFAVFSSAFPALKTAAGTTYFFKRPDLPFSFMVPPQTDKAADITARKAFKKKKWVAVDNRLCLNLTRPAFLDDQELAEKISGSLPDEIRRQVRKSGDRGLLRESSQAHNTINRITQTTGKGVFAPYAKENQYYLPGMTLAVFVIIDESATDIDRVGKGLRRIGRWGFGRDASTGLGRFSVQDCLELALPELGRSKAWMTLAPFVPEPNRFRDIFFTPFVRFGKHGDRLAYYGNPFKNPVIMADEGAVLIPEHGADTRRPFTGRSVTGISKTMPHAVVQGYAPCLPLEMEVIP